MLKIPQKKFYNSYIIESKDLDTALNSILDFLKDNGFNIGMIKEKSNPDVSIIRREEDKQSINIDLIRKKVINEVDTMPTIEKRKIYIILIDTFLSSDIQNTLLKTLEDAPYYVSIFLVIKNREMLLDTVKSRCFYIRDDEDNFVYDDSIDENIYDSFIDLIINLNYKSSYDIIKTTKSIKELTQEQFKNLCDYFLNFIRDILYYKKTMDKNNLIIKNKEQNIISASGMYSYKSLGKMIDRIIEACEEVGYNIDKSLIIEDMFFDVKSYINKE